MTNIPALSKHKLNEFSSGSTNLCSFHTIYFYNIPQAENLKLTNVTLFPVRTITRTKHFIKMEKAYSSFIYGTMAMGTFSIRSNHISKAEDMAVML